MSTVTLPVKPKGRVRAAKAMRTMKPIGRLPSNSKQKAKSAMKPKQTLPDLVSNLREFQRQRVAFQKSRIEIDNRLVANIATTRGYNAGMEEAERTKHFVDAKKYIDGVMAEAASETEHRTGLSGLIRAVSLSRDQFYLMEKGIEKEMEKLTKQLPVAKWMVHPDQRGFGFLSLAIVIGEAGDLANYEAPGKLWRRMGCAPYENAKGVMRMGSTHRSRKSLTAEEWEDFGYSPRRRSVMYVISESLLKGNGPRKASDPLKPMTVMPAGPYSLRYAKKKAEAIVRKDPEWTPNCATCKGSGKTKAGAECKKCGGRGFMVMRPHLHGMLLASKLLLKNLWCEWNDEWDYSWT